MNWAYWAAMGLNLGMAAANLYTMLRWLRRWKRVHIEQRDTVWLPIVKSALAPLFAENYVVRQALMQLAALNGSSVEITRSDDKVTVRLTGVGDFEATFAEIDLIVNPEQTSVTMTAKGTIAASTVVAEPSHEVH